MPSTSKKQHNLMAAVAHSPKFAKKVGIPQSVGEDFMKADKGKQFKRGGEMAESKKMVKKEVDFMKAKGAPKSMVKHEQAEMMGMKKGGKAKCMATGGSVSSASKRADGVAVKGKTKGRNLGDSGKTVGIQSGAKGMKRGGKC
jgi:hypothetical protein